MPASDRRTVLTQVLRDLSGLAPAADTKRLAALCGRLEAGRLRVLIAGEAKRGKSTVANALIGRDVLPRGVTPVTAIATTLVYGRDEHVMVSFAGGPPQRRPLADLPGLVTEDGNPANRLGVADVTVYLDAPLLAEGVELVDTPGTGSVYEHNTQEAHRALGTLDAAVLVLTADPPPSAAERDLLRSIAARSVATFVLLNKADNLDHAERCQALAFAQRVIRATTETGVPIYAVSARTALAVSLGLAGGGRDEGFAGFRAAFTGYLRARRAGDLEQSVTGHARRIAWRLLDEVRLAQRASQLRTSEAAGRVETFRATLAAIAARRDDADDLTWALQRRLLAALNEAARQAGTQLAARTAAGLAAFLDQTPGADCEREGARWLATHARDAADAWRDEQRKTLEASLAEHDLRLLDLLRGELGEIRDAARELLDLDLAVPATAERLVPSRGFFYASTDPTGVTDLLAGAVRRHLPGSLGRRRARAHLLTQARELVPMLIGRARGDLQSRLEESIRLLIAANRERYAGSIGRLVSITDAALADSGKTAGQEQRRQQALAAREQALTGILDRLGDDTAAPEPSEPGRGREGG
jgi:predicted GTPase